MASGPDGAWAASRLFDAALDALSGSGPSDADALPAPLRAEVLEEAAFARALTKQPARALAARAEALAMTARQWGIMGPGDLGASDLRPGGGSGGSGASADGERGASSGGPYHRAARAAAAAGHPPLAHALAQGLFEVASLERLAGRYNASLATLASARLALGPWSRSKGSIGASGSASPAARGSKKRSGGGDGGGGGRNDDGTGDQVSFLLFESEALECSGAPTAALAAFEAALVLAHELKGGSDLEPYPPAASTASSAAVVAPRSIPSKNLVTLHALAKREAAAAFEAAATAAPASATGSLAASQAHHAAAAAAETRAGATVAELLRRGPWAHPLQLPEEMVAGLGAVLGSRPWLTRAGEPSAKKENGRDKGKAEGKDEGRNKGKDEGTDKGTNKGTDKRKDKGKKRRSRGEAARDGKEGGEEGEHVGERGGDAEGGDAGGDDGALAAALAPAIALLEGAADGLREDLRRLAAKGLLMQEDECIHDRGEWSWYRYQHLFGNTCALPLLVFSRGILPMPRTSHMVSFSCAPGALTSVPPSSSSSSSSSSSLPLRLANAACLSPPPPNTLPRKVRRAGKLGQEARRQRLQHRRPGRLRPPGPPRRAGHEPGPKRRHGHGRWKRRQRRRQWRRGRRHDRAPGCPARVILCPGPGRPPAPPLRAHQRPSQAAPRSRRARTC